jgi:hypothetical protein
MDHHILRQKGLAQPDQLRVLASGLQERPEARARATVIAAVPASSAALLRLVLRKAKGSIRPN